MTLMAVIKKTNHTLHTLLMHIQSCFSTHWYNACSEGSHLQCEMFSIRCSGV